MKTIWIAFSLWSGVAIAQDRFEQLQQERQELVFEWKTISERNSGLFGNKSKDDLDEEVDALKKIVTKDNQLQDEMQRLLEREKLAQTQQYNELLRQFNELNARKHEMEDLISRHKQWSKENHSSLEEKGILQQILVVLLLLTSGLAVVFWQKYQAKSVALKKAQGWKT